MNAIGSNFGQNTEEAGPSVDLPVTFKSRTGQADIGRGQGNFERRQNSHAYSSSACCILRDTKQPDKHGSAEVVIETERSQAIDEPAPDFESRTSQADIGADELLLRYNRRAAQTCVCFLVFLRREKGSWTEHEPWVIIFETEKMPDHRMCVCTFGRQNKQSGHACCVNTF
jgi:hypothetical protein